MKTLGHKIIERRRWKMQSLPPVQAPTELRNTADAIPGRVTYGGSFDGAASSPLRSDALVSINSFWEITLPQLRAMQMRSRALRNNLAVFRNIGKTSVEMAIGWGMIPMPKSGNPDFDRRAKAYYLRWGKNRSLCDIRGMQDHCQQQTTLAGDMLFDGEIFRAKLLDAMGRPTRKIYKTEQCGGMWGTSSATEDGWWNGIQYNNDNRPIAYELRQSYKGGYPLLADASDLYPASAIQHIGDLERSNQIRFLPWCYAGLNRGVDSLDIEALSIAKAKTNASLFGNIETPSGDMPASLQRLANSETLAYDQAYASFAEFPAAGTTGILYKDTSEETTYRWDTQLASYVLVNRASGVRHLNVLGTMIPLFRTNEKLIPLNGQSGMNAREELEFMFGSIASAFGAPVQLFWHLASGGTGPNVRGLYEMGRRYFERIQRIMIDCVCQDDYENVIGTGILASMFPADYPGVEPLDPPPGMTGWDVCTWRGAADFTIDRGRDGRTFLELMHDGKMTEEEWWSRLSEDPDEMRARIQFEKIENIRFLAGRRQAWVESGLPEEKFWLMETQGRGSLTVDGTAPDSPGQPAGPQSRIGAYSVEELAEALSGLMRDHGAHRPA